MAEFHRSHPKFFPCDNSLNLEVVSFVTERTMVIAVFAFEQSHNKLLGSAILTC